MLIDGKAIAAQIFAGLKERVAKLSFAPKLAVILVGEDPASEVYVMQKQLKADNINAVVEIFQYPAETTTEILLDKIRLLNQDSTVHGIIVQRPLPPHINPDTLEEEINEAKDVDGIKNGSPFYVPVVLAVLRILNEIQQLENSATRVEEWLKTKNIVLIGKGGTAGKPLMDYLNEKGIAFQIIDSKTENPAEITRQADVIISSVGRGEIVKPDMIKQGVTLIGIGIHRGEDGRLHGDYEEEQIQNIAAFYTPTPGGVGPINVAMLLDNLVTAATNHSLRSDSSLRN